MKRLFQRPRLLHMIGCMLAVACAWPDAEAWAQSLDTTPSRRTLDDAVKDNCDGVSVVVQRCAQKPAPVPAAGAEDDALAKSRAAAKAAFDQRDERARDAALKGTAPDATPSTGGAQRLGGVTVTGHATDEPPPPEQVLQRALTPPPPAAGPTVVHYAPNGVRYECIEKCVGPACCVELRSIPNPARDLNNIGR